MGGQPYPSHLNVMCTGWMIVLVASVLGGCSSAKPHVTTVPSSEAEPRVQKEPLVGLAADIHALLKRRTISRADLVVLTERDWGEAAVIHQRNPRVLAY
jgi:hypothetical protein